VGNIVERIPLPGARARVILADPQPAVVERVVESISGRHQDRSNVLAADGLHDIGSSAVGRALNHQVDLLLKRRVDSEQAQARLLVCTEEDGNLGKARRVHHEVAVGGGDARAVGLGDVDESDGELIAAECGY